jgi:hypothetical protein
LYRQHWQSIRTEEATANSVPRPVQLYPAWDDSVHLYRDGSSDL